MKIILDECLPRRLLREFPEYVVTTVPWQGWAGITNGALLKLVETEFDVFVTIDSNIVHQQNLSGLRICLIILHVPNSRYETLQPLLSKIKNAIAQAKPSAVLHISL